MKNATLIIVFLSMLFVNCNSQQREDKTEQVYVDTNKSIEEKLLNHLTLRNEAFKNQDAKTIYNYSHPIDLKGQTLEEFEKESQAYFQATNQDKLSFKILNIGKINHCNSEYQCLINLRTIVTTDNDEFSFDRKIIAVSKNENDWKFINVGENDLETIKKLYPFICLTSE